MTSHAWLAITIVVMQCTLCACRSDPEVTMNTPQIIRHWGYPVETHYITTSDNYVLTFFRMPKPGAKPVLLQHGFLDSSDTWVMNPPAVSFAFILFDAGFDVWLGNSRGNQYAMNNTQISKHKQAFWHFTWDEMAAFDLPAAFAYIPKVTGHAQLSYIGHSQGTTIMLAYSLDTKVTVVDKFFALCPVAYLSNANATMLRILVNDHLDTILSVLERGELLLTPAFLHKYLGAVCEAVPSLCVNFASGMGGYDSQDMNVTRWDVYGSHFPSPTSTRNLLHWTQIMRTGKFARYGTHTNGAEYDVSKSTLPPTYIYNGGIDTMADPVDVDNLIALLPKGTVQQTKFYPAFGHIDFVWGLGATAIYHDIISNLGNATVV